MKILDNTNQKLQFSLEKLITSTQTSNDNLLELTIEALKNGANINEIKSIINIILE